MHKLLITTALFSIFSTAALAADKAVPPIAGHVSERKPAITKAEWQKMTPEQKRAFLKEHNAKRTTAQDEWERNVEGTTPEIAKTRSIQQRSKYTNTSGDENWEENFEVNDKEKRFTTERASRRAETAGERAAWEKKISAASPEEKVKLEAERRKNAAIRGTLKDRNGETEVEREMWEKKINAASSPEEKTKLEAERKAHNEDKAKLELQGSTLSIAQKKRIKDRVDERREDDDVSEDALMGGTDSTSSSVSTTTTRYKVE